VFVKILYGGSLLGCLIALILVLSGQLNQAERFFSPGGGLEERARGVAQSPIVQARESQAKQKIEHLLRELPLETVGMEKASPAELRRKLRDADTDSGLEKPLGRGGIELSVARGGKLVLLCGKPGGFYCASYELGSGVTKRASGPTLAKAKAKVS